MSPQPSRNSRSTTKKRQGNNARARDQSSFQFLSVAAALPDAPHLQPLGASGDHVPIQQRLAERFARYAVLDRGGGTKNGGHSLRCSCGHCQAIERAVKHRPMCVCSDCVSKASYKAAYLMQVSS